MITTTPRMIPLLESAAVGHDDGIAVCHVKGSFR